MSKRFFIGVTLFCLVLLGGFLLLYKNLSIAPEVSTSNRVLKPLEKPVKQEIELTPATPAPAEASLLAVGDIMLDRSVLLKTQVAKNWEYPFLLIDSLFDDYDLHLANLEGPITGFKSIANGTGGARLTFTFSFKFIEPLQKRFEFLSLANNHAYNFGNAGMDQTRKVLANARVRYFGDPNNTPGFISVTSSHNGVTFGFVGYHQLALQGFENVLAELKKLDSRVDILIVMPHWGTEYITDKPTPLQIKEAHDMVDAGADVILGAHPHVVQPIETYKDRVIFYSLGNFIFDQYFSEDTTTGLAVGMKMEKTDKVRIEYTLIPLDINKTSQPSVAASPKKEKVLSALSKNSRVDNELKKKIDNGKFENEFSILE